MNFNFYLPWIDPRVDQVRTADLLFYLRSHGWREEKSDMEHFIRFRHPAKKGPVMVPTLEESDDHSQNIFSAVTMLARVEERYAGAVLDDLLAAKPPEPIAPAQAEGVTQQAVRS